ncbi:MAG: FkbM family methyltransferase [Magnetococcales bacterium]|nr:FkbM family methyltransferase [Magnetococcales bacterium]
MLFFSIKEILGIEIPALTIIDVGAMFEEKERYAPLVQQGLANVVGFEPNPVKLKELREKKREAYRYFPYVLGQGEERVFHATRYPGCSSLYCPDPSVINLFSNIGAETGGNFSVIETEPVKTMRLDDVSECPKSDYVKIDVQGAELDILKGGMEKLSQSLVMELEAEFLPLYKDQPLFGDLQVFLRSHGFVLHKFIDLGGMGLRPLQSGVNNMSPISQLLWSEAIFVRDFSKIENYSDEDLLKASVILHEIYRSIDLVLYLLREYDRRNATNLADLYIQEVDKHKQIPLMFMNVRDTY